MTLLVLFLSVGCGAGPTINAEAASDAPLLSAAESAPVMQRDSEEAPLHDESSVDNGGEPLRMSPQCMGDALDFDALSDACRIVDALEEGPAPEGLVLSVEPAEVTVAADFEVRMLLRMTNTTDKTMAVSLTTSCFTFQVSAWQNGERKDFASECGGMCGTSHYRFGLAPGGSLLKQLQFHASVRSVVFRNSRCEDLPRKSMPIGEYTLQIRTPFTVSHADRSERSLRIPMRVVSPTPGQK
jgi:hypothetical protein